MYPTLLTEINSKTLTAYLTERVYDKLYFPLFFPFEFIPSLTWESLIGSKGHRIAADVVAYDTSAPLKTRQVVSKLSGEIPAIRTKRKMDEKDILTYDILKNMANSDQQKILDLVYGDVDFVVDAVTARIEWLALQALSKSTLTLTKTNNAGIVTESSVDFQMPSANKKVESAANQYWTTGAYSTNDPIGDIEDMVGYMAAIGSKPRYILMNLTKWQAFRTSTAVQNFVIPFALYGGTKVKRAPSLAVANMALREEGLPEIVIIDTRITLETEAHVQTAYDPWCDSSSADRYVTFIPDMVCGHTYYGPIAEEIRPPKQVTQAKKGPILVSKFSTEDPVAEFTKGEINAFPVWENVEQCMILDTESHTTFGA